MREFNCQYFSVVVPLGDYNITYVIIYTNPKMLYLLNSRTIGDRNIKFPSEMLK